jgi:glycosyltransferase involved in cell wall biosynthesis
MSHKEKRVRQGKARARKRAGRGEKEAEFQRLYERGCRLATEGHEGEARRVYEALGAGAHDVRRRALVRNDLAALAARGGELETARQGFRAALEIDPNCEPAQTNLALLEGEQKELPAPQYARSQEGLDQARPEDAGRPRRVAVLSFLFNWPSTGGGIVHTYELIQFLGRAGYDVRHFSAHYPPWGIGVVTSKLPFPSEQLTFGDAEWNVGGIQERFRRAVDAYGPDQVIITDSWNMKPMLAEAVRGYPYILRFQGMECLCPLNNVRLLADGGRGFRQCGYHQLATPEECGRCVRERGHCSGSLHQAERELSGVGTAEYHDRLLRVMREAEAVLVVNPLQEAMMSPYCERVRVVTAGMDPARFAWPWEEESGQGSRARGHGVISIFQAGVVMEAMKGFHVVHAACERLWQERQDFELVATGEPAGQIDPFTRFTGWVSQEELPRHYHRADIVVVPTVAQEALGRTAVEAMATGRPVVASRLGGLPFTVLDGATGLLCEPGDADDLGRKIALLLDDPELRRRLGLAGRRRFEEEYAWPVIIERHYRPLLGEAVRNSARGGARAASRD